MIPDSYDWMKLANENVQIKVGLVSAGSMKISYTPRLTLYGHLLDEVYTASIGLPGSEFLRNQDVWMRRG
jgi:hypothetical protein